MSVTPAHLDFLSASESWALAALDAQASGSADVSLTSLKKFPEFTGLCEGFGLSEAEAGLVALLFAAGQSPVITSKLHTLSPRSEARGVPTWLALQTLASASAADLAGISTLRRMELIEIEEGVLPIEAHLRLVPALCERLTGLNPVDPVVAERVARLPSRQGHTDESSLRRLARALSKRDAGGLSPLVLAGSLDIESITACLAGLGLGACRLFTGDIPGEAHERDRFARSWSREAALNGDALIVVAGHDHTGSLVDFIDRVAGHVILLGNLPGFAPRRGVSMPFAGRLQADNVITRWQVALGSKRTLKVGARLDAIANHFGLHSTEIDAVCRDTGDRIDTAPDTASAAQALWHAAGRAVSPEAVPGVELVEPVYCWSDIVLPELLEQRLRRIEAHVRHATTVMDNWGFAQRMGGRGRGISVLLSGQSGTGKSMAAEVLASSLDLRVMFIDLSQLISKYIGDTSKNVAAAFRLAERSGAVMVWNEGDAIWGARGSVGNATDRHVNAEIGDLLQRIESFRGFTIVTTNMRQAIDEAFTRRFRFCLTFPVPSESERLRLWEKAFPEKVPLVGLDWAALAKLELTGGGIRNIALSAAFHAVELGRPIDREVIAAEVIEEFRKQDRPPPAINWGGVAA